MIFGFGFLLVNRWFCAFMVNGFFFINFFWLNTVLIRVFLVPQFHFSLQIILRF